MKIHWQIILIIGSILFLGCFDKQEFADLIITNAEIQTVNEQFDTAEAIAIKEGKILHIGTVASMGKWKGEETQVLDVQGAFVMPGFIEGHGHFSGMGRSIQNLNLLNTKSWDEIVALVRDKVDQAEPGEWVVGRGWHQEKWNESPGHTTNGYPGHEKLSEISPDNPIMLTHASGHGLMANEYAMKLAKISKETVSPVGGEIVRNHHHEAIGVFEENAMALIRGIYQEYINTLPPEMVEKKWQEAIQLACQEALENGITSFQDAGCQFSDVKRYKVLAEEEKLPIRLWTMIRHSSEEMDGRLNEVKMVDVGNRHFTCNAIKSELDGALGSYGAWLMESYNDKANFKGQNTTTVEELRAIADLAMKNNMQLCVHAIGDRANHEVLNMVERIGTEQIKDARWRMEHTQHVLVEDIPRFKELGVIASMQAIHCTSDSPFVIERLGFERAKHGAYVWKSLLDAGAVVTNGTDAPVEDVNPLASFYASVSRRRSPEDEAFFPEQALSRKEAIKAYTISNAYAAFEEDWKGSLEPGKVADITILSKNLMTCKEEDILNAGILYTIVDGVIEYQNSEK